MNKKKSTVDPRLPMSSPFALVVSLSRCDVVDSDTYLAWILHNTFHPPSAGRHTGARNPALVNRHALTLAPLDMLLPV